MGTATKVELRSLKDTVDIAPGVPMPRLGLGTFRSDEGPEVLHEVAYGVEVGYRGFDTASMYGNERGVGRALRASGLPREDYFVATKVWNSEQGYETTLEACSRSLERLKMDHVDLYLVHWPIPHMMRDTWRAMEQLHAEGKARSIGVCNFLVPHLEELLSFAEVPPAVDQVEHHPYLQQPELKEYCVRHAVTLQAWAPVMRGRVFEVPELVEIGGRHGKTAAQVTIRWILQSGVTTIPKSVHRERISQNADVYDFELTAEEMKVIDSLDRGQRIGGDPNTFARLDGINRLIRPPK